MAQHGVQHQAACDLQKLLIHKASQPETTAQEAAVAIREWQSLERLKREMRGIPPLKAASVTETLSLRKAKQFAIASHEPVEV